jgi:molybdopterin synthase catalytic subunit
MIEITSQPISVQSVIDNVKKNSQGSLVIFVGIVRDNSEGKQVRLLEYETYTKMAEKKLKEIATEMQNRWKTEAAIVHRIGRMEIGDIVVVIVVGSGHRQEAFQSCEFAINRIKETVPIWKKEYYVDGSSWVGHLPINLEPPSE